MTIPATIILAISALALCLLAIQRFLRNRNTTRLVVNLATITIAGGVLVFSFDLLSFGLVGRGRDTDDVLLEIALSVLMFLAMLLGMGAAYLYARLSAPQAERPPFDLGLFLAPIFTSPLVFIPLVASYGDIWTDIVANPDTTVGAKLMIFLVAFENGFFWKVIFDRRAESHQGTAPEREAAEP